MTRFLGPLFVGGAMPRNRIAHKSPTNFRGIFVEKRVRKPLVAVFAVLALWVRHPLVERVQRDETRNQFAQRRPTSAFSPP